MKQPPKPPSWPGLGYSPLAFWQAGLQAMSDWQRAWLRQFFPETPGQEKAPMAGLLLAQSASAWPGLWSASQPLMAAMAPYLPRVEATVTPLEDGEAPDGASDAARVSMRVTLPGLPGQAPQEVVLVDAVVARAPGKDALPLGDERSVPTLVKKAR